MSILDEIVPELPANAMITDIVFEGSEIVLYTKSKAFHKDCTELIMKIVDKIKKRIEVRADAKILLTQEKTEEFIRETVPKDAGIHDIYFEPEFARVVIHAEKPGIVIGKSGDILTQIKERTLWAPEIKRAPVIDSELIKAIRKMLHKEAGYRKKFLNELGKKIYGPRKDVDWIRMTALGGFREVGRSCILVSTPQSRILLDCGVLAGSTTRPFPYLDVPEFNIQTLDAVVISHAHLDHSGLVPYLYEYGYRGPVYCTRPTRDTMVMLHMDYVGICQREGRKAPYTSKGIEEMLKHCLTLEYGEVTDITSDMRLTLENAGHLLGSSCVHLHIGDGLYNILYTGDYKYERTTLFEMASTDYTRVEAVITESTYGGESTPTHKDGEIALINKIREVIDRGGKVLIPSFANGRAQAVISSLAETDMDVPIYLDGMVWDATAIHTAYPEFLSRQMQNKILHKGKNPFVDPRLKGIGSQRERQEVLHSTNSCIVIATSGMLVGGPAIEYLKAFASDEKNAIIFVGFQAEGTMGRRIQKGWKYVPVEGNDRGLELKLEIVTLEGLSDHSNHEQLMNFIANLKTRPKKVIVNHGETTRTITLARALHKELHVETVAPRLLETIRLR
ncbi:MAG: beta-CASP ribonuclease aCPSF1 [Candidatus Aenigmatarchaeota archaeon]